MPMRDSSELLHQSMISDRAKSENANTNNTGFFRLPPDLRNQIYELALPVGAEIEPLKPSTTKIPPVLQTCYAIRWEALPMYFASNVYILELSHYKPRGDKYALSWMKSVDARGLASIRNVVIEGRIEREVALDKYTGVLIYDRDWFIMDVDFSNLEKASRVRETPWTAAQTGIKTQDDILLGRKRVEGYADKFKRRNAVAKWSEARYKAEMVSLLETVHGEANAFSAFPLEGWFVFTLIMCLAAFALGRYLDADRVDSGAHGKHA